MTEDFIMEKNYDMEHLERQTREVMESLLALSEAKAGQLLIVGGSSSEVLGGTIGKASSAEVGQVIIGIIKSVCDEHQLHLAVQCCEHLNRALVIDEAYAISRGFTLVNARPVPEAGGSFATAYWNSLDKPALAETITADLGLDIGDSFIGMHLRSVAVPIRLSRKSIGEAHVTAAKTRYKLIGGSRAQYQA